MIRAAIFDMDGVLVDSEEMHCISWKKILEADGVIITAKDFSPVFGRTGKDIVKILFANAGKKLEESKIQYMIERKNVLYREIAAKTMKPSVGSFELIKELKANGIKVAMGTSAIRKNVELFMRVTGLGTYFDGFICADDITKGKPDPEVFLKTAELLGEKPENCVVFEDAKHGIEAAKAGGFKAIALATTNPKSELKLADLVINDLSEVSVSKLKKSWI